jgi:2-polyprenyl-6-methoxyphenol hydroxylase-like FAD-dependent oxidoreductase
MVMGADGRHSRIARLVEAPAYNSRPALSFGYYSYWSGVDLEGVALYPREGCGVVAERTNDDLVYVAAAWRRDMFDGVRSDLERTMLATLDTCAPELAERVRLGMRVAPFKGADFPFYFRRPYGPGWTLVGDAGYHRDAITGQGITDAFRDADLLAGAIDDAFSGRQDLEDALASYEQRRNAAVMPMFEFTCKLAALDAPSPADQQLFGALRHNQYETERFLSTIAGSVPIPEFFAETNVERIVRAALPAAA